MVSIVLKDKTGISVTLLHFQYSILASIQEQSSVLTTIIVPQRQSSLKANCLSGVKEHFLDLGVHSVVLHHYVVFCTTG